MTVNPKRTACFAKSCKYQMHLLNHQKYQKHLLNQVNINVNIPIFDESIPYEFAKMHLTHEI